MAAILRISFGVILDGVYIHTRISKQLLSEIKAMIYVLFHGSADKEYSGFESRQNGVDLWMTFDNHNGQTIAAKDNVEMILKKSKPHHNCLIFFLI